MGVEVADRVVVASKRSGEHARTGVSEQVVSSDPPRYRARWPGGHTSTFSLTGGAARIEKVTAGERG